MPGPTPIEYDHGFRVNFRKDGIRYQKKFPHKIWPDAEGVASDYIKEILTGDEAKVKSTIDVTINKYIKFCERNKAPETVRRDSQRLGLILSFFKSIKLKRARDINIDTIRAFEDYFFENYPFSKHPSHRKGAKPNPKSNWEKYRQILSAFSNWCISHNLLKKNWANAKEFKKKYQRRTPTTFSPKEIDQVLEYFEENHSLMITVCFHVLAFTGIRLSEARDMPWDWIVFDNENSFINIDKTKNFTPRIIPIDTELVSYLKELPQDTKYVFNQGKDSQFYSESWLWQLVQKAQRELSFDKQNRNIHSFRHSFCTHMLENGASLKDMMELSGHLDEQTALGYVQLTKAHKKKAIQKLPYKRKSFKAKN